MLLLLLLLLVVVRLLLLLLLLLVRVPQAALRVHANKPTGAGPVTDARSTGGQRRSRRTG